MDLTVRISGYVPGSEAGVLGLLEQTLRELSVKTGSQLSLVTTPQVAPKGSAVGTTSNATHDFNQILREALADPSYQALANSISSILSTRDPMANTVHYLSVDVTEGMSREELQERTLSTNQVVDLRAATTLALQAVNDLSLAVYGAVVVSPQGEFLFIAKAPVGGFGLVYKNISGETLAQKAWFNSYAEAHEEALMAAMSANQTGASWASIEVVDFQTSKVIPKALTVVNR